MKRCLLKKLKIEIEQLEVNLNIDKDNRITQNMKDSSLGFDMQFDINSF